MSQWSSRCCRPEATHGLLAPAPHHCLTSDPQASPLCMEQVCSTNSSTLEIEWFLPLSKTVGSSWPPPRLQTRWMKGWTNRCRRRLCEAEAHIQLYLDSACWTVCARPWHLDCIALKAQDTLANNMPWVLNAVSSDNVSCKGLRVWSSGVWSALNVQDCQARAAYPL